MRLRRFIVVGLGNPGPKYARHRHNLGFMVVDRIAESAGVRWTKTADKAETCRLEIFDADLTLVKPLTYMNLSGKAVAPIVSKSGVDPSQLIVIHDDLDLEAGRIRMKTGGGDGGHKGVRSIADSLRFRDFHRIRMGVGRPPEGMDAAEYVLKPFIGENDPDPAEFVERGLRAVELLVTEGMERARNLMHSNNLASPPADGTRRRGFSLA